MREKDGVKERTLLRGDTLSGESLAEHKTKRFCSGGRPASDSSASLYQQQVSIFYPSQNLVKGIVVKLIYDQHSRPLLGVLLQSSSQHFHEYIFIYPLGKML